MIRIDERALDGGRSFRIDAHAGRSVVAVVHDGGERELHLYDRGNNEPGSSLRMDDDDARRLGSVLMGTTFRESLHPDIASRLGDLVVDWVRIEAGSTADGRSLAQLEVHRRTGMTIVAIVRADVTLDSPPADTTLHVGDRVVVVGQLRQMPLLLDLLAD